MPTQGDDQSWVARALCASIAPDALVGRGAGARRGGLRFARSGSPLPAFAYHNFLIYGLYP